MLKYKITNDGKVKVSINITEKTSRRLDDLRKQEVRTRSSMITHIILEKLTNDKE